MRRLLGILASEPTEFRLVLKEAPRSLAALSREHRDGWGILRDGASAARLQTVRGQTDSELLFAWLLTRLGPHDLVRVNRESKEGVIVQTPWSQRRHAVLVASEKLTDEPWEEITEGMLLRVDRKPLPRWRLIDAVAA